MTLLTPDFLPTKSYPFSAWRYKEQHDVLQEGVIGSGDFLVVQRGAGANMSVDVGAGGSWVQGDDVTRQGLYHLVNDASLNVAFPASDPTKPTLQQLVARIYDSSIVGVSDTPTLEVVPGTPTTGATIDNRTGAGALPNGALRIADVLVPAAAGSIVTANIRDRRPWARGLFERVADTGGDYTTVTGSVAAVSANLQRRVECSGVPVRVTMWTGANHSAAGRGKYGLLLDGAGVAGYDPSANTHRTTALPSAAGTFDAISYVWTFVPAAGSHLIVPSHALYDAGTLTSKATASDPFVVLIEELRSAANNGTA